MNCGVHCIKDTFESDTEKLKNLSTLGRVILIRECDWDQMTVDEHKSPFSRFFLKNNIQTNQILSAVMNNSWFGILSIDIFTPKDLEERFRLLNFGTLFDKLSVTKDMLSQFQIDSCLESGMKFPLNPQLSRFKLQKM